MSERFVVPISGHTAARLVRWHVRDGDFIACDEPFVELDYSGFKIKLVAGVDGVVVQRYHGGTWLPVGHRLARIDAYSMPGKPVPRLADYGLTRSDEAFLKNRLKQLEDRIPFAIALAAAPAGLAVMTSWIIIAAFVGLLIGYSVADPLARFFLGRSDGRFNSLLRYESDRACFDKLIRAAWEHDRRSEEGFWRSLTGHRFEQELTDLLTRLGFEAKKTKGSGDEGIDIVLKQGGKKIIVQCKQTKNQIGPAVARELFGTLQGCDADEAWLATTAGATSGVYSFFSGKPLRVVTLSEIVSWNMESQRHNHSRS